MVTCAPRCTRSDPRDSVRRESASCPLLIHRDPYPTTWTVPPEPAPAATAAPALINVRAG
ncbi:hypothetical protein BE04_09595 [Sorangium cellulosum]|uniref:Uncharacterized protein n=1 Tax=Sorangium cellulosum TaxID=56 RepID=A0A150PJ00_SORCE|nr:hypothetical protein BE04_09595 [Sorangium cellulosum]